MIAVWSGALRTGIPSLSNGIYDKAGTIDVICCCDGGDGTSFSGSHRLTIEYQTSSRPGNVAVMPRSTGYSSHGTTSNIHKRQQATARTHEHRFDNNHDDNHDDYDTHLTLQVNAVR